MEAFGGAAVLSESKDKRVIGATPEGLEQLHRLGLVGFPFDADGFMRRPLTMAELSLMRDALKRINVKLPLLVLEHLAGFCGCWKETA
jgi:hypothetical protein